MEHEVAKLKMWRLSQVPVGVVRHVGGVSVWTGRDLQDEEGSTGVGLHGRVLEGVLGGGVVVATLEVKGMWDVGSLLWSAFLISWVIWREWWMDEKNDCGWELRMRGLQRRLRVRASRCKSKSSLSLKAAQFMCLVVNLIFAHVVDGSRLLHHQYAPKPRMPTHHMFVCLVGFCQREFFNHAFDVVKLRKIDRFFAIECLTRRPAVHRGALPNHGHGVDLDLAHCCRGQCSVWIKMGRGATYETAGPACPPPPTHLPNLP